MKNKHTVEWKQAQSNRMKEYHKMKLKVINV